MIHDLLYRMRAVFRRGAMEAELNEELRGHLEHQVEKHIRSGLSPEEAEQRARFDFGDLDKVKDECRRSWGVQLIDNLSAGVCFGLRQARRNPVFSAVSALALVLGLVANTMMFDGLTSVVQRLSPHQEAASPVLTAQNLVPPPVNRSDAHPVLGAQKVPSQKPSRAIHSHRHRESHPERLASAACEKVATVTAGFIRAPRAGRLPAAAWMVRDAENNSNNFVLISETWRQARPVAVGQVLEMIIYSGNATYVVVEAITGNPEYPQKEGWRPLTFNAPAAMSNSTEWGAPAMMETSSRCSSVTESLSNL